MTTAAVRRASSSAAAGAAAAAAAAAVAGSSVFAPTLAARMPTSKLTMPPPERAAPRVTHKVANQSGLFYGDVYNGDAALRDATRCYAGTALSEEQEGALTSYGKWAGSEATAVLARAANETSPRLRTHDRNGNRVDVVDYVPAYHDLYGHATRRQVPSYVWNHAGKPGVHIVRSALNMMHYQAESGTACPLTMTFAAIPALLPDKAVFPDWVAKGCAPVYDPRNVPLSMKGGAVFGMSMTEKTGGSDVRSNTTFAVPALPATAAAGAATAAGTPYLLTGHKWCVGWWGRHYELDRNMHRPTPHCRFPQVHKRAHVRRLPHAGVHGHARRRPWRQGGPRVELLPGAALAAG